VFLGVLGGVMAFGILGIFLGPTLLAIAYALFQEWSSRKQELKIELP
jgi:predicted PurR-regulated permease PerM